MQQKAEKVVDKRSDEVLYQRLAPEIFAYLLRQTGSREDAEDLLVDVFLAALENKSFALLHEGQQKAWLWKVAHNKAIDHFRRFSRYPKVPLMLVTEMIYDDEALEPEQITLKNEEYERLHIVLKELPTVQQEILQLRFGHGLSCIEIGNVVQKSEGAVRMILSRTLKILRTIYKKQ